MKNMKIEIKNGKAYVFTPYSPEFVKRIKSIGGARWDRDARAWEIPAASTDSARQIMFDVYGETDQAFANEKVDVRIDVTEDITEYGDGITILGRGVCKAWGRDSGASILEGVDFIKGRPDSGGSAKYWCTEIPKGCSFIIHGVPKQKAEDFIKQDHDDLVAKIISVKPNKAALVVEKARLLERIKEIDRILTEM